MAEEGSKTQATTATDLGPVSVVTTAQLKALVRDTQLAMWATAPKEHLRKLGISDAQLVAALREAGLPVVLLTPELSKFVATAVHHGPMEELFSRADSLRASMVGQFWPPESPTTSPASAPSTDSTPPD